MDKALLQIKTILQAALGSTYTVFYGPLIKTPSLSMFPFVNVVPVGGPVINTGTGGLRMEVGRQIDIYAYVNLKNYIKEDTDITTIEHQDAIVKLVEETEADGTFKAATIFGAIFADLTLGNTVDIVKTLSVDYDINEYNGSWIAGAVVHLIYDKHIPNC